MYRFYSTGGTPGSFISVNMPFQIDNVGGTSGDQQWGGDINGANAALVTSSNILSGLANGNYTLEVYSEIATNSVNASSTIANNNSGANYTAAFTVIPEPSAALLGAIGSLVLLRRRR